MPIQIGDKNYYGPIETANKLGITYQQLRMMRMNHQIEDTRIGNVRYCDDEQIARNREVVKTLNSRHREPHDKSDADPALAIA